MRLNGTPSSTASAQSVSTLGLPLPASSWDRVDFATPARRASSVSEMPSRSRSRRTAAAIVSKGAARCTASPPLAVQYGKRPYDTPNELVGDLAAQILQRLA